MRLLAPHIWHWLKIADITSKGTWLTKLGYNIRKSDLHTKITGEIHQNDQIITKVRDHKHLEVVIHLDWWWCWMHCNDGYNQKPSIPSPQAISYSWSYWRTSVASPTLLKSASIRRALISDCNCSSDGTFLLFLGLLSFIYDLLLWAGSAIQH